MIVSAKLIPCSERPRTFKIKASLRNGEEVETECIDGERIGKTYAVVSKYIEWRKHLVKEGFTEKVMRGITYDLNPEG